MWGLTVETWAVQLLGKIWLLCQANGIWWDILKILFLIIFSCYCSECVVAVWLCSTWRFLGWKIPVTMQSLFCFVSEANKREMSQRDLRVVVISRQHARIMSGVVASLSGIGTVFISALRVFGDWKSSGELARLKNIKIRTALSYKQWNTHFMRSEFCLVGAVLPPSPANSNIE